MFFFFNDTATTEIYTLSLHDALPICGRESWQRERGRGRDTAIHGDAQRCERQCRERADGELELERSEEHTSELQSQSNLVCRLLLEKKKSMQKRILLQTPQLIDPTLT